jgi:hypothetical protein
VVESHVPLMVFSVKRTLEVLRNGRYSSLNPYHMMRKDEMIRDNEVDESRESSQYL